MSDGDWSIVTGAAGAIGVEIALLLAKRGPVLAIDQDGQALFHAAASIRGKCGQRIEAVTADIASEAEIARAFACIPDAGRVHALVNSAAIFDHQPAEAMSLRSWERVLRINLTGPFLCSRAAFARMGPGSVIVNIGSINGHRAIPTHSNYATSKAGLMMLTQCLAVEWAAHGIRVVSVSPGIVDTPMNRKVEQLAGIDAREVQAKLPLGRYASASEVARVVAFLASDAAAYISGTDILVDGAWTALGAS